MKHQNFRGTGVALVTPFRNGSVDWEAYEQVIEHVIKGGANYLVCLGSTGESVTLTTEECREVVDATIKINKRRLPIVVGMFGLNYTDRLVQKFKDFNFTGVDAVLSSSPAYNKPTQEGIYQHYMAIAEVSPVPIIIYNVPGRTSSNVLPSTIIRLAKANSKFIAVKEASGDIAQTSQIIKDKPNDFLVISGDDPTALACIACGGDGVISVIGNAFPGLFSEMIRAALAGEFEKAKELNLQLFGIHHWLYVEGNPAGIKAALELQGIGTRDVRLPLVALSEKGLAGLKKEMEAVLQLSSLLLAEMGTRI